MLKLLHPVKCLEGGATRGGWNGGGRGRIDEWCAAEGELRTSGMYTGKDRGRIRGREGVVHLEARGTGQEGVTMVVVGCGWTRKGCRGGREVANKSKTARDERILPLYAPPCLPSQSLLSVLKSKPGIPGAMMTLWSDSRQRWLVPSFS